METRLRPVTVTDAALRLGLARTTVACWVQRGYIDRDGNRQTLTVVDNKGPRKAARYWLTDIQAAELEINLNSRRSHRRSERWQQIQQQRLTHFVTA